MTRYFYTDALAAAWMSKYFGMIFQDYETSDEGEIHDVTYELMLEGDDFNKPLDKYFVHPDSLHLLEPKLGDLVYVSFAGNSGLRWAEIVLGEYRDKLKESGDYIITQRDRIHFLWPESEAA